MVFKRRKPKSYYEAFTESLYPRGGWRRATQYLVHRVRRLPDPAHKISRGIAAGVFACFTPFFGLHFVVATLIAILLRGNIMAALLATFFIVMAHGIGPKQKRTYATDLDANLLG